MLAKARIVVVEDEPAIRRGVVDALRLTGYDVFEAADGASGLIAASQPQVDLVLLDILLPRKDGLEVLCELRKLYPARSVILLTARGTEDDRVKGLKLGADDYLTKPFEVIELLARVEALLRRSPNSIEAVPNGAFRFGDIGVDFKRAEVTKGDQRVDLSAMEFRLLQFFIENRGSVHSRDDLLDAVWGYDAMPTTRTVDVHVAWLRQKLEENPRYPVYIQTVHGFGYKFTA